MSESRNDRPTIVTTDSVRYVSNTDEIERCVDIKDMSDLDNHPYGRLVATLSREQAILFMIELAGIIGHLTASGVLVDPAPYDEAVAQARREAYR